MKESMFLIGRDIGHSLSPAMWNHVFTSSGTAIRYGSRDVGPDGLAGVLDELLDGTVAANVTMPHKAWAAGVADDLDEPARRTGAANLLIPGRDGLTGHNTDVTGARAILSRRAPFRTAVVLGAGGTAAALMGALRGLCDQVVIANRTGGRASDLAARFDASFEDLSTVDWARRDEAIGAADIVVSTIPVLDVVPFAIGAVDEGAAVYDVLYRDRPTALQTAAAERGLALSDGLAHLAAQAIEMLTPLAFDPAWSSLLADGLERATGRRPLAWGTAVA